VRDESQANREAVVAEEDLASLVASVTKTSDLVEVQHFPVPARAAFDVQDGQPEMMNANEFCHTHDLRAGGLVHRQARARGILAGRFFEARKPNRAASGPTCTYLVELLGSYSNPRSVDRLKAILAGHGRDRPSTRTVRSLRRNQRKLRSEEIQALVAARIEGAEIDALAERFGIGRNTVMAHLEREGVPGRRWPGRTLTPEQLEAAGRLYETGVNLIAVGEQFGVDRRYLRKALPAGGFTLRKPGQQKRQAGSDRSNSSS
jgi:transposase